MQTVENLADSAPNTWVGRVFAGRYELTQIVGGSDRWVIFEACDTVTGSPIGVTALRPDRLTESTIVEAFERAARLAVDLPPHPNIVSAFDWGCEGDVRFVVTEWMDGPSLKVIMERPDPIGVAQSIFYAGEVGAALDFAERRGITVSSVDPSLVWTTDTKTVKLNSMGLWDQTGPDTGRRGLFRVRSKLAPTSVAALGLLLYKMLAGVDPPLMESQSKSGSRRGAVAPPSTINPSVPDWLDGVVLAAIGRNKRPAYDSVARMREALGHREPLPQASYGATKGRARWGSNFMAIMLVFVAIVSMLGAYAAYRGIERLAGTSAKQNIAGSQTTRGGNNGGHHRGGNNSHPAGNHHRTGKNGHGGAHPTTKHHRIHHRHHKHPGRLALVGRHRFTLTHVYVSPASLARGATMSITYTIDNLLHQAAPVRLRAYLYDQSGNTLTDSYHSVWLMANPGTRKYTRYFTIAQAAPVRRYGIHASITPVHGHGHYGRPIHVDDLISVT